MQFVEIRHCSEGFHSCSVFSECSVPVHENNDHCFTNFGQPNIYSTAVVDIMPLQLPLIYLAGKINGECGSVAT